MEFYFVRMLRRTMPRIKMRFVYILLILTLMTSQVSSTTTIVKNSIQLDDDVNLQLLLRDPASGFLFAAATNALYKFDAELNLLGEVKTGPVEDSIDCDPAHLDSCQNLELKQNEAKVFLLNPVVPSTLVFCGSVKQGLCAYVNKTSFKELRYFPADNKYNFVGGNLSTTAFFSSNATEVDGAEGLPLYVAMEYDNRPFELWPEMFSSRRLHYDASNGTMWLTLTQDGPKGRSALDLPEERLLMHPVKQVMGFEYENFVFFLNIQYLNLDSSDYHPPMVTRLTRFCRDDPTFASTVDLKLNTRKEDPRKSYSSSSEGPYFNIAVDAHLRNVTQEFIEKYSLQESNTPVLFIYFKFFDDFLNNTEEHQSGKTA